MRHPVIEAHDVTIGWSAEESLIEHASFEVKRGEIFAILGRSASGKSTLLRVLVGLEEARAGTVRVLGREPALRAEAPQFGILFQDGALFNSLTVAGNIELPLQTWSNLPPDAVRALALAKLRLVGLETTAERAPSTLSGGMRKRVALARALALDPSLIFLDEPSSGLDPVTSAEIDLLIGRLARVFGLTVVLVTHELGSIHAIADRCILLDRASKTILAEGTPDQLAASTHPRVRQFFRRAVEDG
jgi:phospholipid/cholesterol/gamma-HCH transport system ATP-binding protein